MACIIVVGGQYGSEGKGKVTRLYAGKVKKPFVVRVGGPNSGHKVTLHNREDFIFRQLPSTADLVDTTLFLAAGCVVEEELLLKEIEEIKVDKSRVIVDPECVLLEEGDKAREKELRKEISSTASGTGEATVRRLRRKNIRLVKDSTRIGKVARVESVAPLLHLQLEKKGNIIVEGTQGFGLSLYHGVEYPFVTSRDTTASGCLSEVGLSPRVVTDIVMVIRTFPIRVGGPSGPLKDEVSWKEVGGREEYTSVTKTLRRVGRFDLGMVRKACEYNQPTALAVMGLDRLKDGWRFVEELERELKVPVILVGVGPGTNEAIWLKEVVK